MFFPFFITFFIHCRVRSFILRNVELSLVPSLSCIQGQSIVQRYLLCPQALQTSLSRLKLTLAVLQAVRNFEMDYSQSHPDLAAGQEAPPAVTNYGNIKTSDTYDGSAPIYQWDDEYGDVGPKIDQLELELFGDPATRHERAGLDFRRFVQRIPSTSLANILKHRKHRGQAGRPCQD